MPAIRLDPEEIQGIARACQSSGQVMSEHAQQMQSRITQLTEALEGIPNLAIADDFQHLNSTLKQLSSALDQSNSYLNGVVAKINEFVASLQRR